MTISTTETSITYDANGSTIIWTYSFPSGPDPDIHVAVTAPSGIVTDVTAFATITPNAPIDPNPTGVGGQVQYPIGLVPPLAVGYKITLFRDVPVIQTVSIANQSIIYPPVIEKALDYLTMAIQELEADKGRELLLPPGEVGPMILPPCPERANKFLGFDENCNPIARGIINPITTTNALRVPPDEGINPLPARPLRPGTFITFDAAGEPILVSTLPPNVPPTFFGSRITFTGVHTVVNTEKGSLIQLAGNAFYDLILGNTDDYDADFSVAVANVDVYLGGPGSGRGKRIMLNGVPMPETFLWPGQWIYIFRLGSTWVVNPRSVRWRPLVNVQFHVDPVLGKDDGTADGLATGAGAFKTIATGLRSAYNRIDFGGLSAGVGVSAVVQLAPANYFETIVINQMTNSGAQVMLRGAPDLVTNPDPWKMNANGGICLNIDNGSSLMIRGVSFVSASAGARAVYVTRGSYVDMANCAFGAFPGPQGNIIGALGNSRIDARDISILGNCSRAFQSHRHSTIKLSGALTVGGGLAWANQFVDLEWNGQLLGGSSLGVDSTDYHLVGGAGCTGAKYLVAGNSTGNLGPSGFPNLPGVGGVIGFAPIGGTDASAIFQ